VVTLTDDNVPVADVSNEIVEKPVESLPQVTPSNDTPEADVNKYQQQVSSVSAPTFVPEPVHASAHIPTVKTKSKKSVIIAGIIAVIVLVIGAFVIFSNLGNGESSVETSSSLMHDNPYIQNVKNVHMFGRSDVLLGDAFNSFFDNPEWEVSSRTTATVEFNGSFQFEGRVSSTHMLISSNPDIVGHVTLLMINGEIRNDVVGELLESIFEQYVGDGTASSRDFHSDPHIQEVINGHFRGFNDLEFPNITIGEALNAFFDNMEWELSDGSVTEYDVHFFGDMIYNGELVRVEIVFVPSMGSRIEDGEFVASLIQIGDTMSETSLTSRGHNFIEQIFGSQSVSRPNIIDTAEWVDLDIISIPPTWSYDTWRGIEIFGEGMAGTVHMHLHWETDEDIEYLWDNATDSFSFGFNDGNVGWQLQFNGETVWISGNRVLYWWHGADGYDNWEIVYEVARTLIYESMTSTAQTDQHGISNNTLIGLWSLQGYPNSTLEFFANGQGIETTDTGEVIPFDWVDGFEVLWFYFESPFLEVGFTFGIHGDELHLWSDNTGFLIYVRVN